MQVAGLDINRGGAGGGRAGNGKYIVCVLCRHPREPFLC